MAYRFTRPSHTVNADSLNYPYQLGVYDAGILDPDVDCFAGDCDGSDDEYRYPDGQRRIDPVFYDGEA